MKIFVFKTAEGDFIIAAKNAKEAIMFYFTKYIDDIQTDELVESEGIKIKELDLIEVIANRKIYNEEKGEHELISYQKLANKFFKEDPEVLVSPVY